MFTGMLQAFGFLSAAVAIGSFFATVISAMMLLTGEDSWYSRYDETKMSREAWVFLLCFTVCLVTTLFSGGIFGYISSITVGR